LRQPGRSGLVRDGGDPGRGVVRAACPFAFTGTVRKVVFDINPHLDDDEQALHERASRLLGAHGVSA
jgi:hypothetical protein